VVNLTRLTTDEFAIQLGKKAELSQSLINLHIDNLSSPHNDWL
jgi:STE24 endopeptidase